jgi:hypothetical protein
MAVFFDEAFVQYSRLSVPDLDRVTKEPVSSVRSGQSVQKCRSEDDSEELVQSVGDHYPAAYDYGGCHSGI